MAGKAYGREIVRAMPESLDGRILTGQIAATTGNESHYLSGDAAVSVPIAGVVVKADGGNSGLVYIVGHGASGASDGFPLAAGESISLATDDLRNVQVQIASQDDAIAWIAIAK